MRAIVVSEFGGPEVLQVVDAERPSPIPTEVLVEVHAAGVNPVDWKTREGRGAAGAAGPPPFILGWDVAGVVKEVGRGVTIYEPGDRVFGMPWFPRAAGAYAEFVTAPSRQFARMPDGLAFEQAAALPLAGLTAWQALMDTAQLGNGQTVLINGATGGVGHLAVQIAKARGARVVGTARSENHDFLRELGADECVDYTQVELQDAASRAIVRASTPSRSTMSMAARTTAARSSPTRDAIGPKSRASCLCSLGTSLVREGARSYRSADNAVTCRGCCQPASPFPSGGP